MLNLTTHCSQVLTHHSSLITHRSLLTAHATTFPRPTRSLIAIFYVYISTLGHAFIHDTSLPRPKLECWPIFKEGLVPRASSITITTIISKMQKMWIDSIIYNLIFFWFFISCGICYVDFTFFDTNMVCIVEPPPIFLLFSLFLISFGFINHAKAFTIE